MKLTKIWIGFLASASTVACGGGDHDAVGDGGVGTGGSAAAIASGISTGGNAAATGGSSPLAGNSSTGDVLDQLKVTKGETPRTDSLTRHPLQKPFTAYKKRSELYLSGVTYNPDGYFNNSSINIGKVGGKRQFLLDDKLGVDNLEAPRGYKPLYSSVLDQLWTTYPSASTAANLRGDGRESAMVLYRNPTTGDTYLRMIRRAAGLPVVYEEREYSLGSFELTPYTPYPTHDKLQIAAGDVDNDGTDELVLAIGNRVVVEKYDKTADSFSRLYSDKFGDNTEPHMTSVAVGNVDDEPGMEVVIADGTNGVTGSCTYSVFSWAQGTLSLKASGWNPVETLPQADGRPLRFATARVTIGDLNNDGLNEIAFAGDVDNNNLVISIASYQTKTKDYKVIASAQKDLKGANWLDQYLPVLTVFSPEGVVPGASGGPSSPKDLLAYKYIYRLDADGNLTERWPGVALGDPWNDKVVVGDFTGQGKDYVAYYSGDNSTSLQIWGYETGTFHQIDVIDIDPIPDANAATLCPLNIDDDTTVVKYSQQYDMLYSQPQIIAVLAFPPYYEGQDVGNAYTAFGWQSTSDSEQSKTLGVYAGLSLGFSVESPFWGSAASTEVKLNVDTSLDFTSATTNSWSGTAKKTCMGGDEGGQPCVVFSYTPVDVYYYEVVSSPDAGQVGRVMSVQVPRSPRIADTTLDNFNAVVSAGLQVPAALTAELTAQLGHPERYPSRTQMLDCFTVAAGGLRTPDGQLLEVSAKSTAINDFELTMGQSTSVGQEFNLEVGIEAETVVGGALVGGRAGFHYAYSQTSTVGHATIIEGGVPGIMASLAEAPFNVGLFAYKQKRSDGGQFVVVDYWVEQ